MSGPVFEWDVAKAAADLAEAERAPAIDERHAFIAVLASPSGTARAIRDSIGAEKYRLVEDAAKRTRPKPQGFTETTELGPLD